MKSLTVVVAMACGPCSNSGIESKSVSGPLAGSGPLLLCIPDVTVDHGATSPLQEAAVAHGFSIVTCNGPDILARMLDLQLRAAIVFLPDSGEQRPGLEWCWRMLRELHGHSRASFTIVLSRRVCGDAALRLRAFAAGARMVTDCMLHLEEVLRRVAKLGLDGGSLTCPTCGLQGMTEDELHLHHPLYHAVDPNDCPRCPICGVVERNFPMHLHNSHGPLDCREPAYAPFAAFAWAVCRRRDGRFLMVNEPAGISRGAPRYWLPAGRVDSGESLLEAARRETLEEGGISVRVTGVLRFMVEGLAYPDPCPRVIFLAEPDDETEGEHTSQTPKSVPDWESVGALWVEADVAASLDRRNDFRSPDPADLFPAVASGSLRGHSVDTEAFRKFDEVLIRLTRGGRLNPKEFRARWASLKDVYPSSIFDEH